MKNFLIIASLLLSSVCLAQELPILHSKDGQIYDQYNRLVVLHGVNQVDKQPPYISNPDSDGFDNIHAKFIADHGMNIVRLGVMWTGIEPNAPKDGQPAFDDKYLAKVKNTVQLLASYGIYTLIDFHHDAYGKKHGGLGAPDWAVLSKSPWSPAINPGFPLNEFGDSVVDSKKTPPVLDEDNDDFWANQDNIQTDYQQMVLHTINYLNGTNGIIGYDLINEPSQGSAWHQAGYINNDGTFSFANGCKSFDQRTLSSFYINLTNSIHQFDKNIIVWIEPNEIFSFDAPTYIKKMPGINSRNVGFSFHDYYIPDLGLGLKHAFSYQRLSHTALLVSEFGANTLKPQQILEFTALMTQSNLSWIYWTYSNNPSYKFSKWPSGSLPSDPSKQSLVYDLKQFKKAGCNKNNHCTDVNWPVLNALTQAYPQYVAGNNLSYHYDTQTRILSVSYSGYNNANAVALARTTQIAAPSSVYPKGYTVTVSGATQLTSNNSGVILVLNNSDAKKISIEVKPANSATSN